MQIYTSEQVEKINNIDIKPLLTVSPFGIKVKRSYSSNSSI